MKMRFFADRRRVVGGLLGSAGLTVAGPLIAANLSREMPPLQKKLLLLLDNRASAAEIGRLALSAYGNAATENLTRDLVDALGGEDFVLRANRKQLKQNLSAVCRKDFADGAVTPMQGWVLSATETKLCALAALSQA